MGWTKSYEKYLINKKSTRPWERKNWPEMRGNTIKNLIMSQALVVIFIPTLTSFTGGGFRVRFDNFPSFL